MEEKRNSYESLVIIQEGKGPFERYNDRWKNNILLDIKDAKWD
jgi:hypothetical protein